MYGKFRIGDVLPASEYLSTWITTIAMMLNDVVVATSMFEKAVVDERPTKAGERIYWFRLASSHYREAVKYLDATQRQPHVVDFIKNLPEDVRQNYRLILDNSSKPKEQTVFGQEVVTTRNNTFHYPSAKDIQQALQSLEKKEGVVAFDGKRVKEFRALFADQVLLEIMGFTDDNEATWSNTIQTLGQWTGSLINFCNFAVSTYLEKYEACIDPA